MDLVVVGHIAFNEDRTPSGTVVSHGGSAYYCARGAGFTRTVLTGVVAPVGADFDLDAIDGLNVDTAGVRILSEETTPRFTIVQDEAGGRSFTADFGAATDVHLDALPPSYLGARHFHLATAPPHQQHAWLEYLRAVSPDSKISVDCFEQFARDEPEMSLTVCNAADLVFMNEEESALLGRVDLRRGMRLILKRGAAGALYADGDGACFDVPARRINVVDTTGAGELLAGVFLSLELGGLDTRDALRRAAEAASFSVGGFGVDGPELAALLTQLATIGGRPIDHP